MNVTSLDKTLDTPLDTVICPETYPRNEKHSVKSKSTQCPIKISKSYPILVAPDGIEPLIIQIQSGVIPFPYARGFLPSAQVMMKALRVYKPTILHETYTLRYYYPNYKVLSQVKSLEFRGKSTIIQSRISDYLHVDGLTDLFNEEIRNQARKNYTVSVEESWKSASFLRKVLSDALSESQTSTHGSEANNVITQMTLRDAIYRASFETGLFRLSWSKGLLLCVVGDITSGICGGNSFSQTGGNSFSQTGKGTETDQSSVGMKQLILDISAGWGDRLLTAIACGYRYCGFDPNVRLKSGHDLMISQFGNVNEHVVCYEPFETATIPDKVDVIFSSPPFFDLEIYTNDVNQSIGKYPKLDVWIKEFLYFSLRKAWNSLIVGGYLILHMCDTYNVRICEGMNEFLCLLPSASYQGMIGITNHNKERISPVWIYRKV